MQKHGSSHTDDLITALPRHMTQQPWVIGSVVEVVSHFNTKGEFLVFWLRLLKMNAKTYLAQITDGHWSAADTIYSEKKEK